MEDDEKAVAKALLADLQRLAAEGVVLAKRAGVPDGPAASWWQAEAGVLVEMASRWQAELEAAAAEMQCREAEVEVAVLDEGA
jgi:hypothetical protein